MCDALKEQTKRGVENLKRNKAPRIIIEDYIAEMSSGDAVMCDGCDDCEKCFPDAALEAKDE
jgi:hypothetical protein